MSELHWDWDGDPEPDKQALIDEFYENLFYEPDLSTAPIHHEEMP